MEAFCYLLSGGSDDTERHKEAGSQQSTLDKLKVGRNHLEQPLPWLMELYAWLKGTQASE